jgi:RNA polymerase sigma-70 factor (ECF subfamily)
VTDLELLDGWIAGDVEAGHLLVKRHYQSVYLFFFGKVGAEPSEDLTQTTFETLCQRRADFRGDSSLRKFIFGIARFKLIRHFERLRGPGHDHEPLRDSVHDAAFERSMTSLLAARDREMMLVQALRRLPLDDQLLLELKDYEQLTARELAAVFEVPPGTIASRLQRARERLRRAATRFAAHPDLVEDTLTNLDLHMRSLRAVLAARGQEPT